MWIQAGAGILQHPMVDGIPRIFIGAAGPDVGLAVFVIPIPQRQAGVVAIAAQHMLRFLRQIGQERLIMGISDLQRQSILLQIMYSKRLSNPQMIKHIEMLVRRHNNDERYDVFSNQLLIMFRDIGHDVPQG